MPFDTTKPNTSQTIGDVITSTNANLTDLNAREVAHEANQTNAHGIDALITSKADYVLHKANVTDAHGINVVAAAVASAQSEVTAARGAKADLATRLNVALQTDGGIKLSSIASKWLDNGDVPTFISTTSFSVPGDRTKVYIAGVLLRCTVSATYAYAAIASSAFGAGITTVVLDPLYPILTGGLSKVEIGLIAWDNSVANACTVNATNITALSGVVAGLKILESAGYFSGVPTASKVVHRFIATRAFSLPINCTNSQFKAAVAATASTAFSLAKNGAAFGTATFAAAGTSATFAAAGSTSFAAGDMLTITAPATPDATLADLVFNLQGVLP